MKRRMALSILFFCIFACVAINANAAAVSETTYVKTNGKMVGNYMENGQSVKKILFDAPSEMKEGVVYTRDDAYNFIANGKTAFAYESPYQKMDLNQNSNLTAKEIKKMIELASPGSELQNWSGAFADAEQIYGVNVLFLVAHAALSTGWGKTSFYASSNHAFGEQMYERLSLDKTKNKFSSPYDSILYFSKYFKENFLFKLSLVDINKLYVEDKYWNEKTASIMERMRPYSASPQNTNPPPNAQRRPVYKFSKITGADVNVRKSPSPQGTVLATMQDGTLFAVRGTSGEWTEIMIKDGGLGWVNKKYIVPFN